MNSIEPTTFSFGDNWLKFLKSIKPEQYIEAKKSLRSLLCMDSLAGKSFLDIGCGSGIFSLAAIDLGARSVISIDRDPKSVKACREVKKRGEVAYWNIFEGSILDKDFIRTLGQFDIVYSWGVLHHTGDMWQAIDNACELVNENGFLAMAIYNKTKSSNFWLRYKQLYNRGNALIKSALICLILLLRIAIWLIKFESPFKTKRGMSMYHDAVDWAGGFPYQFATFDKICSYLDRKGFKLKNGRRTSSTACNEFLFEKI